MTYNTEKRADILKLLSSNQSLSYTVEEICEKILDGGHGKSTVYRLIAKLCEEGSVKRVLDSDTGRIGYQYIGDGECAHHLHLKCKECGAVIHLDSETTGDLLNNIKNVKGFAIELGALIYGVCEGCVLHSKTEGAI